MFLLTHGILTCYVHVNLYTTPAKFNQFNRGKTWCCTASITMNIPIVSFMSLSTCEVTQSSLKNDPNDSIESIDSIYVVLFWKLISLPLFGRRSTPWTFLWDILIQFIWSNHNSPSKSTDSVTYSMKELTQSPINSLGKGLNQFNHFAVPN